MKPLDILYTPLDVPEPPEVDIDKLLEWGIQSKPKQNYEDRYDSSEKEGLKENYPWDIVYWRHRCEWQNNFDKEFPQLSEYITTAFGVDASKIYDVMMLPLRDDFTGLGFWHADPDEYGIRFYLRNKEPDGFMLFKPTNVPYFWKQAFDENIAKDGFQNKVIPARLLKSNQAFYLNNIRAHHTINVQEKCSRRLTILIGCVGDIHHMPDGLSNLIVNSAQRFPDYAIKWQLPKIVL
jgi:hypothetical protein